MLVPWLLLACSSSAPTVPTEPPAAEEVVELPPPEVDRRDAGREAYRLAYSIASRRAEKSTCPLPSPTDIELRFTVADGKTSNVGVYKDGTDVLRSDDVGACWTDEIKGWAFPPGLEVDTVKLGVKG